MFALVKKCDNHYTVVTKHELKKYKNNSSRKKNARASRFSGYVVCSHDNYELLDKIKFNIINKLPSVGVSKLRAPIEFKKNQNYRPRIKPTVTIMSDVILSGDAKISKIIKCSSLVNSNRDITEQEKCLEFVKFSTPNNRHSENSLASELKLVNSDISAVSLSSETCNLEKSFTKASDNQNNFTCNMTIASDENKAFQYMNGESDPYLNENFDIPNGVFEYKNTELELLDINIVEDPQILDKMSANFDDSENVGNVNYSNEFIDRRMLEDYPDMNMNENLDIPMQDEGNAFDRTFIQSQLLDLSGEEVDCLRKWQNQFNFESENNFLMEPVNKKFKLPVENSLTAELSDEEYIPESENDSKQDSEILLDDDKRNSPKNDGTIIIENNKMIDELNISPPSHSDVHERVPLKNLTIENSDAGLKKHACFYCNKLVIKIARHLEQVHHSEERVKKFLCYKPKDPIRKSMIARIRNEGDFNHNEKRLENRIVVRRPNPNKSANVNLAYCPSCKGSYRIKSLSAHFRFCTGKDGRNRRIIKQMSKRLADDYHPKASKILRRILCVLREDDIAQIIKFDELLILYGNILAHKYKLQHQQEMIRARLRLIARFLQTTMEINPKITDLMSLFDPKFFNDCVKAGNILAGLDTNEQNYKKPSVALLIGTLLKQIGEVFICECIQLRMNEKKADVKDFIKLMTRTWSDLINKTALESQAKQKRQKKEILPSIEDITKLMDYLIEKQTEFYDELKKEFSIGSYLSLNKILLIRVQLFNRRRAGEAERILVEDYQQHERVTNKNYPDILKNISDEAKKICEKYIRFSIRGKLARGVSVLLDEEMFQAIELLLENRKAAEIHENNPYFFALPGHSVNKYYYLRACPLMRTFANECGAIMPNTLRGTKLRKHIATHFIKYNLSRIKRSQIANHLGHNMGIHKSHYQMADVADEIIKLSQVLEKASGKKVYSSIDQLSEVSSCESASEPEEQLSELEGENSCSGNFLSIDQNKDRTIETSIDEGSIKSTKKIRTRKTWTIQEVNILQKHFSVHIKNKTLPSYNEISEVQKLEPLLKNRLQATIKTWFSNYYKKSNNVN